MKYQGLKKVAIPILVFVIVLLLPLIVNAILIYAQSKNGVKEIHTLNLEFWYDIVAIAIPSFLTLLVLLQSEEQQQVNEKIQKRMERINERMLNSELKAHLGYFLPEIDEAGIGGKIIPVRHNLHNRIDLIHSGDDIVFVMKSTCFHGGKAYVSPQSEPVCFLNQPSFRRFLVDCCFDESELKAPRTDVVIELILQNSKGYQYKQSIDLGFENLNNNEDKQWIINRFNMRIEEVPADAD